MSVSRSWVIDSISEKDALSILSALIFIELIDVVLV